MDREIELKFLALLVHRGLLDASTAKQAVECQDPSRFLIENGIFNAQQWRELVSSEAGSRPTLARYELFEALGEGGEARVFRARDRKTGEIVAVKVLRPELCKDTTVVKRFVAEARLLQELDCPHIVKGLRVARDGDCFFSAMEVIEGECLLSRLEKTNGLDEEQVLRIVVEIARALEYLHERGLVHRDVKPGNVMLNKDGRAVLIDLGFAVGGEHAGSETTAGTVHYISPEQARGRGGLDVRADIYSLGATLYHLVTGSLPFTGSSSEEVLAKQVLESLSSDRIREMNLSPQVHYFVERMMAKDKTIRFQDPQELIAEIDTYLAQRQRERERNDGRKGPRTRRKRRKWL